LGNGAGVVDGGEEEGAERVKSGPLFVEVGAVKADDGFGEGGVPIFFLEAFAEEGEEEGAFVSPVEVEEARRRLK